MLLFTALVPPAEVVESLRTELDRLGAGGDGLRWSPPERWHITLGFYGEQDDIESRVRWLRPRLAGQQAPVLRLEGAGSFSGVLWLAVYSEGLTDLALAAGAGQDERFPEFLPHLSIARGHEGIPEEWPRRLAGYSSEPWTADEVVLMRSDRGEHGPEYSVVERFELTTEEAR